MSVFSQSSTFKAPDYEAIKKVIQDVSSSSYYHELLRSLSLQVESNSLVGKNFDYLKLKQNNSNIEGIYFNIEKMRDTQK